MAEELEGKFEEKKKLFAQVLYPIPYTLYPIPCRIYPTPCTLHPTPYILTPTRLPPNTSPLKLNP